MEGLIIGIAAAVVLIITPFLYLMLRTPVVVSPKEVAVRLGPEGMKNAIQVKNRTSRPLFDVWVKTVQENCNIEFRYLRLYPGEKAEPFLLSKEAEISEDYATVRVDGEGPRSKKLTYFIFNRLDPKETGLFTLEIIYRPGVPGVDADERKNPRIITTLERYSRKPVKMMDIGGSYSYPFVPPKGFKLRRVLVSMKKK